MSEKIKGLQIHGIKLANGRFELNRRRRRASTWQHEIDFVVTLVAPEANLARLPMRLQLIQNKMFPPALDNARKIAYIVHLANITTKENRQLPTFQFTPRLIGVVLIGLVAVSFASILIRWCEAPALSIAFYRLSFASLFFAIFAGKTAVREWQALPRAALRIGVLSGIALAAHFAMWITSLSYTSVASSTVLVSTAPIFVALGTRFILREPTRPALFAGIIVAIIDAVTITATDAGEGHNSWRGDLLALGGAVAGSIYFLTGRRLRRQLSTPAYVVMSYSAAALTVLLGAFLLQTPLVGFSGQVFGMFLLIALIPQVIGHTSFNWALKHLSAPAVSVLLLGEPIGASILAYLLLDERLGGWTIIGGAITLVGVGIALLAEAGELKVEDRGPMIEA